jgi:hypothetical protein
MRRPVEQSAPFACNLIYLPKLHLQGTAMDIFEKQKESDKETHAWVACMVWIGSGLYLYLSTPGVSLFSLSALGFFLVGIFVAAIAIGGAGYLAQRTLAAMLVKTVGFPGPKMARVIMILGVLLFVGEIVVGYKFAKAAFLDITGA